MPSGVGGDSGSRVEQVPEDQSRERVSQEQHAKGEMMDTVGSGTSRVKRYLAHLDVLSGGVEPQFWPIESTKPGLKGLTAIGYRELPEAGMFLGLTYGLSPADHPLRRHGKTELCICVVSDDPLWVLAVATLAEWKSETATRSTWSVCTPLF